MNNKHEFIFHIIIILLLYINYYKIIIQIIYNNTNDSLLHTIWTWSYEMHVRQLTAN